MCLQSAAGLCVGIGSFCDPPEVPGLAHFLEHSESLFLMAIFQMNLG